MSAEHTNGTRALPLFLLSSVVLPGGLFALRVFEARYLDMISDCLKRDDNFGICLIRSGEEAGAPAMPYGTGTQVRIVDWDRQPDGLLGITVQGEEKFHIHELKAEDDGLVVAEVEPLPPEPFEPVAPEFDRLREVLRMILDQLEPTIHYEQPRWDDARWVGGRLTELLPLTPRVRQFLLELDNPTARLIELNQALK